MVRKVSVFSFALFLCACGSNSGESTAQQPLSLTPEQLAYENQLANEQAAREEAARIAQGYTDATNRVLIADVSANAPGRNSATIASSMASIDLTGTPGDFRSAYLEHIEAWRQVGRIDDALARLKSDDEMGQAVTAGVLTTIFGSDATPFSDHISAIRELERRRPEFSEAINSTYATVKSVAARYDAAPPAPNAGAGSSPTNSM